MNRQLGRAGHGVERSITARRHPTGDDRTIVENGDRKPGPGMLLRAADELGLDLDASWMVGDMISDVLAGLNAGCRSVLVRTGQDPEAERESTGRRLSTWPTT